MAAVGGARERPVGTRVGVVAASSDVIRLLPAKTSVSCAVLLQGCAVTAQDNRCLSELDSLDSLFAGAPIAETSPCKVDAAFDAAPHTHTHTRTNTHTQGSSSEIRLHWNRGRDHLSSTR